MNKLNYEDDYGCGYMSGKGFYYGGFCTNSKTAVLQKLNPHYSEPQFSNGQTHSIFGKKDSSLFYVYNDRLDHSFWNYCWARVTDEGAEESTAEKYEKTLQYYYDDPTLDLKNIMVGVNVSTGYAYHVYGFKCGETNSGKQAEIYHKMVKSAEYQKIKDVHTTYEKQNTQLIRVQNEKKYALERIERLKKELKELEKSLPKLDQNIVDEQAKIGDLKTAFGDIVEQTVLPMPYHNKIWVY